MTRLLRRIEAQLAAHEAGQSSRTRLEQLLRWTLSERWEHRSAIVKHALDAPIPGSKGKTADLARELFVIARTSLDAQAREFGHESEAVYLEPLGSLIRTDQAFGPPWSF
jgi:hypothetical protein